MLNHGDALRQADVDRNDLRKVVVFRVIVSCSVDFQQIDGQQIIVSFKESRGGEREGFGSKGFHVGLESLGNPFVSN